MFRLGISALLGLSVACGHSDSDVTTPRPAGRPQLVVAVVVDQFPTWALEKYLPLLDEKGILRRSQREGAVHWRVELKHAATITAPGHASYATGVEPARSGIAANDIYRGTDDVSVVDDGIHAVHGVPGAFASPSILRVESIGDALKGGTRGRGKVVSISLKDRAAIPAGGQKPDAVYWYEKKLPGFTTSTYYQKELPSWFTDWKKAHPIDGYLQDWQASDDLAALLGGCDACPGEGDSAGLGTTFPHSLKSSTAPYSAFRATVNAVKYQFDLVRAAAAQHALGQDEVPDLLHISVSSVDYAGHVFGGDSWEYFEVLRQFDRELTRLVDELSTRTRVAVLVSADHGGARLPEAYGADGNVSGRVSRKVLAAELEAAIASKLGPGPWITGVQPPYVYFSPKAKESTHRGDVLIHALAYLGQHPGIYKQYLPKQPAPATPSRIDRAVTLSMPEDPPGDIYYVLAPHHVSDVSLSPGAGTNHGTPWEYDRFVPLLAWGASVQRIQSRRTLDHRQIAPSISKLLGVPAPSSAKLRPAPGL